VPAATSNDYPAETRQPVVLESFVVPLDEETALVRVDPQLDKKDSRK